MNLRYLKVTCKSCGYRYYGTICNICKVPKS